MSATIAGGWKENIEYKETHVLTFKETDVVMLGNPSFKERDMYDSQRHPWNLTQDNNVEDNFAILDLKIV